MNRRMFLKSSGIAGVAVVGPASLLTVEGCSTATLKSYLNAVLDSAEKILALSSSTDSWFITLSNAIAALKATEANWDASTAVSAVISALDTLEAILAVIPVTSAYSNLIDLLVSVIETILTTFVKTNKVSVKVNALAQGNPHRGRVPLRDTHFLQSKVGAYKSQWNEIAADIGVLDKAKL
jgi:hypothetical protein